MAEPQIAIEGRNHEKMAEMVGLIAQRGPKIDEIARLMGVHNETVRHWYRQLLNRGFVIQAACNYESLGMKRVVLVVELDNLFRDSADVMFYVMNQFAYVIGYAKTKLDEIYILSASVPYECLNLWTNFLLQLKEIGVFKSIESVTLDWVHNIPMRADCFNFDNGKWKFSRKSWKFNSVEVDERSGQRQKYDVTDLKIIGQLQIDANMSLTEMCEKVGANNYKTFTWHFRKHVFSRHMIKGYRVNWTGMTYGAESENSVLKYRYSWVDIIGNGLSQTEIVDLAAILNRVPFVWIEGSGARVYYARMVFPVEEVSRMIELIEVAVAPARGKVKWFHMDQAHGLSFSLETQNYDESQRRWNFNKEEVLQSFEALRKIRHEVVHGHLPAGESKS